MSSILVRASVGALLVCFMSTVVAAVLDSAPLTEIVITATRTPMPTTRLAVPVSVVTRTQIERSMAGDAADLLSGTAGVEIARNGGPGQPTSMFLRGSESNHTAVLVDGVRINPATIGGAALQNLLPESIERIEVVRGARSSLYGTDAIGGVVNITTRAGSVRGASAGIRYGRYDTREMHVDGGATLGERISLGGSFAERRSEGFAPQVVATEPRGYVNRSASAQVRFQASDATTFKAQAWRAAGRSEYLGYDAFFSFGPLDQDFRNAVYAVSAEHQRDGQLLRAVLSRAEDIIVQRQSSDAARTERDALDLQYTRPIGAHQLLTVGTVLAREQAASESFGTSFDEDTATQLAFLQDQLQYGVNDLLLAVAHTHHESFGNHVTWNAEYGRTLDERWYFSAAAGTAFHAPDHTDRFGFGGNPALQPERSRQLSAGIRWQPAADQQLALTLFDSRIDDLVVYQLVDPVNFTYRSENLERARTRGMELTWELRRGPWWLRSDATWQRPRNESQDEPLLRRARHHYGMRLQHEAGRRAAGVELLYSGARYDSAFPALVRLPGHALLHMTVEYHLSDSWIVQGRLDNALDRSYQLVYGYNTPRRGLTLATRYRLN